MAFNYCKSLISEEILFNMKAELYDYQREAVDNTINWLCNSDKLIGQIILPTGAGKTKIAEYLTAKFMNEVYNAYKRPSICGIACHRLVLANNLLERILEALASQVNVKNFELIVVNSNSYDNFIKKFNKKYHTNVNAINIKNCSKESLKKRIETIHNKGKHVFFIMLYHSLNYCIDYDVQFDFVFCDEAHTTVEKQHFAKLEKFVKQSEVVIHMTATPTETSNGKDMKHAKDVYGDIIIEKPPRELVISKHICPINLILLEIPDKNGKIKNRQTLFSTPTSVMDSIMTSANSLFKKVEQNQINSNIPETERKQGVLFVTVNGNKHLTEMIECNGKKGQEFAAWRAKNDVDLYIISAEKRGWIDYSETPDMIGDEIDLGKEAFLRRLEEINKTRHHKAIIVFIDMLAEGVDLPDINGVLLLRALDENTAKILQVIGRAVRRDDDDRNLIENNNIKFDDSNKFKKPCAYVYIPFVNFSKYEIDTIMDTMLKLYSEYGDIVFHMATRENMYGEEIKLIENFDFKEKLKKNNPSENYSYDPKKVHEMMIKLMSSFEVTTEEKLQYIKQWIADNRFGKLNATVPSAERKYFESVNGDIDMMYNYLMINN